MSAGEQAVAATVEPARRPGWLTVKCPTPSCRRKVCEITTTLRGTLETVCPRCRVLVAIQRE